MVVVLEKTAYGVTILRGRTKEEWLVVPWWPCSGEAIRTIATAKLPGEWVDECARLPARSRSTRRHGLSSSSEAPESASHHPDSMRLQDAVQTVRYFRRHLFLNLKTLRVDLDKSCKF